MKIKKNYNCRLVKGDEEVSFRELDLVVRPSRVGGGDWCSQAYPPLHTARRLCWLQIA